jgi:signal transduction histidine kinase
MYENHPQFETESQRDLVPIIFIAGFLISVIFFRLSRSQYIAQSNAQIAAIELKRSQKELENAIGLRDNFISIASHELKTPVTSLKVYTEVLLRQFSKKNDKKTTEHLTKILKQIDKLTLLIQDLLNVSRIQSNQLTYRIEKFDVNILVKEVIESTQQIAEHHRIVLQGSTSHKVWGDKERISQVIVNFITNALKYSPKSNKVIVSIKDKKTVAEISVKDFGIGINKEHQKKIFERFYRVDDANEPTYPGLGIGLYISQAIAKKHGSKIIITSRKKEGSTFTFTLPYQKNQLPKEKE